MPFYFPQNYSCGTFKKDILLAKGHLLTVSAKPPYWVPLWAMRSVLPSWLLSARFIISSKECVKLGGFIIFMNCPMLNYVKAGKISVLNKRNMTPLKEEKRGETVPLWTREKRVADSSSTKHRGCPGGEARRRGDSWGSGGVSVSCDSCRHSNHLTLRLGLWAQFGEAASQIL